MNSPLIVALDLEFNEAIELAQQLDPDSCRVKVGSKLFTSSGPKIVEELINLGFDVFLDLKFHDIPNTVSESIRSAADLGVWMVNLHASGGSKMMINARNALDDYSNPPLLVAVTMLTSLGDNDVKELGMNDISSQVMLLAELSKRSGLDGVVCSPNEVSKIKKLCGSEFIGVTPGIRSINIDDDQSRVSSHKEALNSGSDFLVIGRPITKSPNPVKSVEEILKDLIL